ncbi:MAG: Hpt domain-containing protein [Gammaproteobacteria bacterium]|nr:Hpt domain-containing protein [Gammaproteobacteria bacterium]
MSEPRNFMALDWVKGEIEDTLRSAREALEAFFESPDDTTLARQCLTNLHQVNGTLQMVELHGAAALATEMEALAQALMNNSVADNEAALESLMEGILQLPSHLDRVHRGGEDDPRVHALLMDRMRVARGEAPWTRREEMAVDPEAVAAFLDSPLPVETRKLRSNYQRGMVALIRKQPPPEKIWPFLDRIFTRLEQITPDSPLQRLWGLAAGVMEIRTADGEPPSTVVPLLRGLDQQLKDLVTSPEASLSAAPPPKLRDGLVAIINASEQDSERLSRLRQALVPVGDEPVDSGPIGADDETIATVARALHEELADVRDRLDLHVRGSVGDTRGLQSIGEDLKRVAGTLQVVGLEELQKTIATQADWIRDQAEQGRPDEDAIMEIASAVLFVDSALMGLAGIESEDAGGMPGSSPMPTPPCCARPGPRWTRSSRASSTSSPPRGTTTILKRGRRPSTWCAACSPWSRWSARGADRGLSRLCPGPDPEEPGGPRMAAAGQPCRRHHQHRLLPRAPAGGPGDPGPSHARDRRGEHRRSRRTGGRCTDRRPGRAASGRRARSGGGAASAAGGTGRVAGGCRIPGAGGRGAARHPGGRPRVRRGRDPGARGRPGDGRALGAQSSRGGRLRPRSRRARPRLPRKRKQRPRPRRLRPRPTTAPPL